MGREERSQPRKTLPGSSFGGRVAEVLATQGSVGRLKSPSGVGEAGSVECGSLVRIEVAVADGMVREAKYQAYGCPATLAGAQTAADRVREIPVLEAARVGSAALTADLELPPDKGYAAENAIDALHAALGAAVSAERSLVAPGSAPDPGGVLVGMSGGVDSAVAALLLREQGYRVVGVTLGLWDGPESGGERSCCSPATVRRARRVAHSLGLPHVTIDASDMFYEAVVKYFIGEYEAGRTPNPCAKCNSLVRFGLMLDVAERLGLSWVATGHYARFTGKERVLTRGTDAAKDQSYVLAEVEPAVLRRVLCPLGGMTKPQVRALAVQAGLEGHSVPESQEICFIPDDDHRRFLRERLGERPGAIIDRSGSRLSEHPGTYNYTIGQRKGLGIAAPEPLYVVDIDAEHGEVTVGAAEELDVAAVTVGGLTWHQAAPRGSVSLQVRSSGAPAGGRLELAEPGGEAADRPQTVTVVLDRPARAVAAGQTGVVYQDGQVVCAGTIIRTRAALPAEQEAVGTGQISPVV